jgi:hypothetical protein
MIPVFKWEKKVHASDGMATVIGSKIIMGRYESKTG